MIWLQTSSPGRCRVRTVRWGSFPIDRSWAAILPTRSKTQKISRNRFDLALERGQTIAHEWAVHHVKHRNDADIYWTILAKEAPEPNFRRRSVEAVSDGSARFALSIQPMPAQISSIFEGFNR